MAKKRSHGEGSLRQLPNGHWECQVMIGYKPNGKRDIKSFSAKTQREAKAKKDKFLKQRAEGLEYGANTGFNEWADIWYEECKGDVKPTTQESYKYTLQILKDYFGRTKITDIRTMHIEAFLRSLRDAGRSNSALAKCRGMLYQIFNMAEVNNYVLKNPVALAKKMKRVEQTRKEVFSADQVRDLMENLPENKIGWSIRLMLGTGMRTQEVLGLEPRHIKADGSEINIEQAVAMVKGTAVISTPKSSDSIRTIPVPEMVQYCARRLRDTTDKFVWESPKKPGNPCNPSHFRSQYYKALESMENIPALSPHCCRHTFVSQMQALGVDLPTIQNIVGHADIDMTKHYLHVQKPVRDAAAQRFSDAFSKKGRGTFGNILDYVKSS